MLRSAAGRAGSLRSTWSLEARRRMASTSSTSSSSSRRAVISGTAAAATLVLGYTLLPGSLFADASQDDLPTDSRPSPLWALPSRAQMLQALKESSAKSIRPNPARQSSDDESLLNKKAKDTQSSSPSPALAKNVTEQEQRKLDDEEGFDLLVIGGGATGAGVAVDAATRGLSIALVEKDDFGAGMLENSHLPPRP